MIYCIFFRLEQAKEAESKDALKDLVNLITSLTTYGVNELKPAGVTTGVPFLLPGFAVPQPAGKGECLLSPSVYFLNVNDKIQISCVLHKLFAMASRFFYENCTSNT